MKKQQKSNKRTYWDYGDESHHISKKVKTEKQRKANNNIDRLLKSKNLRNLEELYD